MKNRRASASAGHRGGDRKRRGRCASGSFGADVVGFRSAGSDRDADLRPRRRRDLRREQGTVCPGGGQREARTCRSTLATKRGSPLDATDFSRSVTFSKSCDRSGWRGYGSAYRVAWWGTPGKPCGRDGHVETTDAVAFPGLGGSRTTSRTSSTLTISSFFSTSCFASLLSSFISTSAPMVAVSRAARDAVLGGSRI